MTDTTAAALVLRAVFEHAQAALDDDRGDQHQALEEVRDMAQCALAGQDGPGQCPTEAAALGAWLRAWPDGTILLDVNECGWQRLTDSGYDDRDFTALGSLQSRWSSELTEGHRDLRELAGVYAPFRVLWRPPVRSVFDVAVPLCAVDTEVPAVIVHAFPPVDDRSSTRPYRSGSNPQPRCGADSDRMAVFAADVSCPDCLTIMREQDAAAAPAVPSCGACAVPFDPADTRFDGHARHGETSWCRSCIDRCHEGDADHRCPICRDGGPR
jgi:hypothetical protein